MTYKKNESAHPDLGEVAINVWNRRYSNGSSTRNDYAPPDEFVHGVRSVDYHTQGLFTAAIVTVENRYTENVPKMYVGIAKRNPCDRNVPIRGRALALQRALDEVFTDMAVADLHGEFLKERREEVEKESSRKAGLQEILDEIKEEMAAKSVSNGPSILTRIPAGGKIVSK